MIEIPPEAAASARLAFSLFGAGGVLLALEIFFANRVFLIFGGLCIFVSAALAFAKIGIEVGSLLLLGGTTLVSLGFLITLAFFPNSPLARRYLPRVPEIPPEE